VMAWLLAVGRLLIGCVGQWWTWCSRTRDCEPGGNSFALIRPASLLARPPAHRLPGSLAMSSIKRIPGPGKLTPQTLPVPLAPCLLPRTVVQTTPQVLGRRYRTMLSRTLGRYGWPLWPCWALSWRCWQLPAGFTPSTRQLTRHGWMTGGQRCGTVGPGLMVG